MSYVILSVFMYFPVSSFDPPHLLHAEYKWLYYLSQLDIDRLNSVFMILEYEYFILDTVVTCYKLQLLGVWSW